MKDTQNETKTLIHSLYNELFLSLKNENDDLILLNLDKIENDEQDAHFHKFDLSLIQCPHCLNLKQGTMVPKFLLATHDYISHCTQQKQNNSEITI